MRGMVNTKAISGFLLCLVLAGCSAAPSDVVAPDPILSEASAQASKPGSKKTVLVRGEARVLRGEQPQPLLHPISKVVAAYSFDQDGQRVDYEVGKDLVVTDKGVARTMASSVPDFEEFRYSPDHPCDRSLFSSSCARAIAKCTLSSNPCKTEHNGAPSFWYSTEPRVPELNLNHVVYFDYESHLNPAPIPATPISDRIAKVQCFGDSIGAGAHTVANYYEETDEQSWCGLLRKSLAPNTKVENHSVGGATLPMIDQLYREQEGNSADVVIFAAGMNDHVVQPETLDEFETRLNSLTKSAQERGSKVILVGFFQQNPLWVQEVPADTQAYNAAIKRVALDLNVPFVDIAEAFTLASPTHEPYYHLTGDYMHHPNNYGQRIYYSLLLPFFLTEPQSADRFAAYVQGPWQ
ncbi:MAG: SGNH/GDSL hydrolase family protein [Pseudomonadota bacterium]